MKTLVCFYTSILILLPVSLWAADTTDAATLLKGYTFRPYVCNVTGIDAGPLAKVIRTVFLFAENENEAAKIALNKIDLGVTRDTDGILKIQYAPTWGGFGSVSGIVCQKQSLQ